MTRNDMHTSELFSVLGIHENTPQYKEQSTFTVSLEETLILYFFFILLTHLKDMLKVCARVYFIHYMYRIYSIFY